MLLQACSATATERLIRVLKVCRFCKFTYYTLDYKTTIKGADQTAPDAHAGPGLIVACMHQNQD